MATKAQKHTVTAAQFAMLQKLEAEAEAKAKAGLVGIQSCDVTEDEDEEGTYHVTLEVTMVNNVSQGLRKRGPNWGLPYNVVDTAHFAIGNTGYGVFLNIGPNIGEKAMATLADEDERTNWLERATAVSEASGVTKPVK